jgi:hypothetical protein
MSSTIEALPVPSVLSQDATVFLTRDYRIVAIRRLAQAWGYLLAIGLPSASQ